MSTRLLRKWRSYTDFTALKSLNVLILMNQKCLEALVSLAEQGFLRNLQEFSYYGTPFDDDFEEPEDCALAELFEFLPPLKSLNMGKRSWPNVLPTILDFHGASLEKARFHSLLTQIWKTFGRSLATFVFYE